MQTDMSAWNDAPLWDKESIDVATKKHGLSTSRKVSIHTLNGRVSW